MLRKILITMVMGPLIVSAAFAGTSGPVLLLMVTLFLIALGASSAHDEQKD